MEDTKTAIIVRDDLLTWQKLNVTAFLTSGVLGVDPALIGERYADGSGQTYRPLMINPVIVLAADGPTLKKLHGRALSRGVDFAIYIEDMFATGDDVSNRAAVARHATEDLNLVGISLRAERKIVDKITKRARMHP